MFRSRIADEIRPHERIPRICQITLVDYAIWRSGMKSHDSVQLPTLSEITERSIMRIERLPLPEGKLVVEASREHVGEIESGDTSICAWVIGILQLTSLSPLLPSPAHVNPFTPR